MKIGKLVKIKAPKSSYNVRIIETNITPAFPTSFANNEPNIKYSEGLSFVSNNNGTCYVSGMGECKDTDLVIPLKSPTGDTVTSIGVGAFSANQKITSVYIPDTILTIQDGAFNSVRTLTSLVFHSDSALNTIRSSAFNNCGLVEVNLPSKLISVGQNSFAACYALTNVFIPKSTNLISSGAFSGSVLLQRFAYDDTVEKWKLIQKESNWDAGTGVSVGGYEVHCTNGYIDKSGTEHKY